MYCTYRSIDCCRLEVAGLQLTGGKEEGQKMRTNSPPASFKFSLTLGQRGTQWPFTHAPGAMTVL